MVYLREAHANDEWPLGKHVSIPQHRCLEDRLAVAREFQEAMQVQMPVLVDGIEDEFVSTLKAHPQRYYLFAKGQLLWAADPFEDYPRFDAGFDLKDLSHVIKQYSSQ